MKQCIDEGVLQSFYDGELGETEAQKVTTHLLHCATCSAVAGELNRVTDLVSAALAPEFQAPVPTERLRTSINAAIADLQVQNIQKEGSFFASFKNLFVFDRPQAFGFASLVALVVFAAVFGIVYLRQAPTINPIPPKNSAGIAR
jgi:anti-sigma factor RsiW